jgi:hypothetical protein
MPTGLPLVPFTKSLPAFFAPAFGPAFAGGAGGFVVTPPRCFVLGGRPARSGASWPWQQLKKILLCPDSGLQGKAGERHQIVALRKTHRFESAFQGSLAPEIALGLE